MSLVAEGGEGDGEFRSWYAPPERKEAPNGLGTGEKLRAASPAGIWGRRASEFRRSTGARLYSGWNYGDRLVGLSLQGRTAGSGLSAAEIKARACAQWLDRRLSAFVRVS